MVGKVYIMFVMNSKRNLQREEEEENRKPRKPKNRKEGPTKTYSI